MLSDCWMISENLKFKGIQSGLIIKNMNNKTIISVVIWSPQDKQLFFTPTLQDKGKCTIYYCEKADTCELLKRGQCINNSVFSCRCPYGSVNTEYGFNKKSKQCHPWIEQMKKEYGQYNRIKGSPPDKLAVVGEFVYIPYAHMTMNTALPIEQHSSLFLSGTSFIRIEQFTIETIKSIVDFRPYALMGGEITQYQLETIPKFLVHLMEEFYFLYKEFITKYPEYITKYKLVDRSYIGRTALLKTTNPYNISIGKDKFSWNGTCLTSIEYNTLWIDVKNSNGSKAIKEISVNIVPADDAVIEIENNGQVNDNTVFVD